MKAIKLTDMEVLETGSVFKFDDGDVTVVEREVHEFYALEPAGPTRLIIDDAIERTKNFIAKSRSEIAELSAVWRELTAK